MNLLNLKKKIFEEKKFKNLGKNRDFFYFLPYLVPIQMLQTFCPYSSDVVWLYT